DQKVTTAFRTAVLKDRHVKTLLKGVKYRVLFVEPLERVAGNKAARPTPPTYARVTIYDYTNNQTLLVTGRLESKDNFEIVGSSTQPLPTSEEFAEAVSLLSEDPDIGSAIRAQRLQPYPPMPPLLAIEQPDGRIERTVAVGLLPRDRDVRHEIV